CARVGPRAGRGPGPAPWQTVPRVAGWRPPPRSRTPRGQTGIPSPSPGECARPSVAFFYGGKRSWAADPCRACRQGAAHRRCASARLAAELLHPPGHRAGVEHSHYVCQPLFLSGFRLLPWKREWDGGGGSPGNDTTSIDRPRPRSRVPAGGVSPGGEAHRAAVAEHGGTAKAKESAGLRTTEPVIFS